MMKAGVKKAAVEGAIKKQFGSDSEMANTMISAMSKAGGKGGAMGKLASSGAMSSGDSMMEMLGKLPPELKNKLMADRASKVAVKKGGKVSKAKPIKAKRKSTKTVKKQSGHNRLY